MSLNKDSARLNHESIAELSVEDLQDIIDGERDLSQVDEPAKVYSLTEIFDMDMEQL